MVSNRDSLMIMSVIKDNLGTEATSSFVSWHLHDIICHNDSSSGKIRIYCGAHVYETIFETSGFGYEISQKDPTKIIYVENMSMLKLIISKISHIRFREFREL